MTFDLTYENCPNCPRCDRKPFRRDYMRTDNLPDQSDDAPRCICMHCAGLFVLKADDTAPKGHSWRDATEEEKGDLPASIREIWHAFVRRVHSVGTVN